MRYKLLGHTGLRVSELCLGTMTFGTDWGRNLDMAFTAWGALGAGLLTGKYNDDPTGGGGRIYSAGWGTLEERKLAIAREVSAVAQEIGCSPSRWRCVGCSTSRPC